MFEPRTQASLLEHCTQAAFGYTAAAGAAYVDLWSRAMGNWAHGVRAASDAVVPDRPAPPRSWYRHPDQAEPGPPRLPNPFELWTNMLAPKGPPQSWPFAFVLMAFGTPPPVAWPTARANAATVAAAASVNEAFSAYRTDGGHAAAQIVSPAARAAVMWLGPLAAATALPWANVGDRLA